jgi:hypothetical protein
MHSRMLGTQTLPDFVHSSFQCSTVVDPTQHIGAARRQRCSMQTRKRVGKTDGKREFVGEAGVDSLQEPGV